MLAAPKTTELKKVLEEANCADFVVSWMMGPTSEKGLGIDSCQMFLSYFAESSYEREISEELMDAELPQLFSGAGEEKTENRPARKREVASLRMAYKVVKRLLEPTDEDRKSMAAATQAEMEAPLDDGTRKSLESSWVERYSLTVPGDLSGADALVGRTYREWKARTPTVPPIAKVKSLTCALMPRVRQDSQLPGSDAFIGFDKEKVMRIQTVIDYYWGLRILANVWARVGNFEVEGSGGDMVRFFELSHGLDYADNALRAAADTDLPPAQMLKWLERRDLKCRTRMMELMRKGETASKALASAVEYTRNDWESKGMSVANDPSAQLEDEDRRSRSPKGGRERTKKAKTQTTLVSHAKGGKRFCQWYGQGKCSKGNKCQDAHACAFRMPNGGACGKNHPWTQH